MRCTNHECFACSGASCNILTKKPKAPTCPFFKTYEQNQQEAENARIRLIELERYDLISKYGVTK